jgi:hypothetical protein
MGLSVNIYGTLINTPQENTFEVENWGTKNPSEQYWRRTELPSFFDEVEYDRAGNLLLSPEQWKFAHKESERCKNGFYFLNNGVLTYLTGKNYFYLQWWKLEDDIYADFRDTDRKYFLFLNHWENILWTLGVIRGKKRREGASSQACSNLMYEAIFFKNSNCGLISKTRDDSRDTFLQMVSFGYRQLPVFFKPKQLNDPDSVTELIFAHKSMSAKEGKSKTIDTDTGHRSKINYRAPVLNAYDRGRISRILLDEFAKLEEVDAAQLFSIISKTLIKGIKRVGFVEMPSSVNEMTKHGGAAFKIMWDKANHFVSGTRPTINRLVRYFSPAYEGFEGFIDKHGLSVTEEPTVEQYEYLVSKWVRKDQYGNCISELNEEDIRLGSKKYLLKRREGLEGIYLEEEIRMNPFDEREMFMSKNAGCHFNQVLLNDLFDRAKVMEKETIEYGNFMWEEGVPYTRSIWFPCDKQYARWHKPKGFKLPESPTVEYYGITPVPLNTVQFISGCDPFQNNITEDTRNSKASAAVLNRFEPGTNNEIFNRMFGCKYHWRQQTAELLHNDMALQCFAFGCKIAVENVRDGGMIKYFEDNGLEGFLIWMPGKENAGIYPDQNNKALLVNQWEHYLETEGRQGKLIYPDVIDDEHDGLVKFDINNTERSNQIMGLGWTLVADFYNKTNFRKKEKVMSMDEYFPKHQDAKTNSKFGITFNVS